MNRNLLTLLFGATLLVVLIMMAEAQPDPEVQGWWPTRRPTRPTRPTRPPTRPTRPPTRPTRPPTRPTRPPTRPTRPPTRPTRPPTRPTRPTYPTWRTPPTWRTLPTRPTRPTWRPTRGPRPARAVTTAATTAAPLACPRKPLRCTTAGPSLCVRSRNGKLCRRVANKCVLRNLNCQSKPRNNWVITNLKGCCKLKVGQRPVNCRNL